jgi:hypothetical protein
MDADTLVTGEHESRPGKKQDGREDAAVRVLTRRSATASKIHEHGTLC